MCRSKCLKLGSVLGPSTSLKGSPGYFQGPGGAAGPVKDWRLSTETGAAPGVGRLGCLASAAWCVAHAQARLCRKSTRPSTNSPIPLPAAAPGELGGCLDPGPPCGLTGAGG